MAGVTGLIVAIGVTADSFIVYFERIRDEVREGRPLRAAVETGWKRARRTILAADGVNFLAAVVLYFLAVLQRPRLRVHPRPDDAASTSSSSSSSPTRSWRSCRGTKFFGGGHTWSGLDPRAPRRQGHRRPGTPGVDGVATADRLHGPRAKGARHVINFAALGNDLYTGKRVDRLRRPPQAAGTPSRRCSSSSPCSASSAQG